MNSLIRDLEDRIKVAREYNDTMMLEATISRLNKELIRMKENSKWMNDLVEQGYKYFFVLPKNLVEVYATKAEQKRSGGFRLKDDFDVFTLEKDETFTKDPGVIYSLKALF